MVSCFLYFVVLQQPQVLLLQQECVLVSAEEFGEEARRDRVAACFFAFANPGEKKKVGCICVSYRRDVCVLFWFT
jgi:hypothetical protein